ncbi:uncharacterized protein C8Q71DRAFT_786591 [Rhodofomes roseus]|uniref:DUF6533 domain-containing protein n=1 Tax=Rhodofomes roseus TaxID=34475 RepID=A0ABQ8K0R7_9APHY|nr:uncharacterized protein C8Q71DRAFT_786591 [Rhodofomes roseus]KAH9830284.1 hypothetical protein C8Q71DRAFT_786591 [Rhodofomes roseus]
MWIIILLERIRGPWFRSCYAPPCIPYPYTMSSVPAAEAILYAGDWFDQSCADVVVATVLVYDYFLTVGDEIDLFWRRGGHPVCKVLFLSLRVVTLGVAITTVLATQETRYKPTIKDCAAQNDAYMTFMLMADLIIAVVTCLRVYAVSGFRWTWTILTAVLEVAYLVMISSVNLIVSYQTMEFQSLWTCWQSENLSSVQGTAAAWAMVVCATLSDMTVVVATWIRAFPYVRLQWKNRMWAPSITWLLFRDGTIYFLIVLLLNIGICISFWSSSVDYIIDLNVPLKLVLISRLLINLREAQEDDIYKTSFGWTGNIAASIGSSPLAFERTDTLNEEETTESEQVGAGHGNTDSDADAAQAPGSRTEAVDA